MKHFLMGLVIGFSGVSLSNSKSFGSSQMADKKHTLTAEQRKEAATAHQKMAECLKSDRDFGECHKEMMEAMKKLHPGMTHGKGESDCGCGEAECQHHDKHKKHNKKEMHGAMQGKKGAPGKNKSDGAGGAPSDSSSDAGSGY